MPTDPDFPWALHYSGQTIGLNLDHARQLDGALREAITGKTSCVVINYLLPDQKGRHRLQFLIGPGIPALLTGPPFPVTDIVDRGTKPEDQSES